MKKSFKSLIKNVSFSVLSSIISMIISTVVILVLPKTLSTDNYGYYQLYSLYIGYVGFFQFGIIDGLYIRYGGYYYDKLDKDKMNSTFVTLSLSQSFIAIVVAVVAIVFFKADKQIVLIFTGIELVLANVRGMFTYVLQSTNRIKEGAISNTIGRVAFFIIVIVSCVLKNESYVVVILADIAGRVISLTYSMIVCRDIVFRKRNPFAIDFKEIKSDINVGLFLMLSSIASLLIMGIVRIAMENKWGIDTFAKVSLTVSVSNLMVQFINAASLVFFPVFRRAKRETISEIYWPLRMILMIIMYSSMLLYFPISRLLILWLPKYETGLVYMSLLFPMCIYEGRMSLINNTYLKVDSKTKLILLINFLSVILSLGLTCLSVFILEDITISMLSLVIAIGFRCLLADFFVARNNFKRFFIISVEELLLMAAFVLSSWYFKNVICLLLYLAALIVFAIINGKSIINSFSYVKAFVKK